MNKSKFVLFIIIFGLIGSIIVFASQGATPGGSEPRHGLIIQVSTLAPSISPTTLKTWLEQIRQTNNTSSKSSNGTIDSIVLQDVADAQGKLLTNYLDVIVPYLPGGATPAFKQAYIGTVDVPWTGKGSKYLEGIEDNTFRSNNIFLSAIAANTFTQRYPSVQADWYVTYEANLAGFWDPNIETAYATYMQQLVQVLSRIQPNKNFMWSPAFWTAYNDEPTWALPDLKTNLTDLFTKVKPLSIDLQDFVGQSGGTSTKEIAVTWVNYLKQNWQNSLVNVMVNAEQFKQNPDGSLVPGDATEVPARESYYVQQGIQLGPAWEIRYWHQRLFGT